jgi:SCY1-like protein 1
MGATQSADFPYTVDKCNPVYDGKALWKLHTGTKKADGSPVSVLVFDGSNTSNKPFLALATNYLRRLKTLRHPNILPYIAGEVC